MGRDPTNPFQDRGEIKRHLDQEGIDEAFKALLTARAEEPERVMYLAFFDAAMDTLRKGTPGLTDNARVAIARSIAMKCRAIVSQPQGDTP